MNEPVKHEEHSCGIVDMRSFDAAMKVATAMAQSQLVPKDCIGRPENIVIKWQYGQELGISPMEALRSIVVVNGTPCLWGDTMLAVCTRHPAFMDISETISTDGMAATCVVKRKGRSDVKRTFSKQDAERAGLWGKPGPWTQYPPRMMQLRARAFALRDMFPDATRGLHSQAEMYGVLDDDLGMVDAKVVADDAAAGALLAGAPKETKSLDEQLAVLIGDRERAANYVLTNFQKYIGDGQTWRDMSEAHKIYCLDHADSFCSAIEKARIPEKTANA